MKLAHVVSAVATATLALPPIAAQAGTRAADSTDSSGTTAKAAEARNLARAAGFCAPAGGRGTVDGAGTAVDVAAETVKRATVSKCLLIGLGVGATAVGVAAASSGGGGKKSNGAN